MTYRFKARLRDKGAPPIGTWLMSAAPSTAEALGYAGFDFLVVDMEHVPIEFSDCRHSAGDRLHPGRGGRSPRLERPDPG